MPLLAPSAALGKRLPEHRLADLSWTLAARALGQLASVSNSSVSYALPCLSIFDFVLRNVIRVTAFPCDFR
jgi:hypothetical protein